MHAQPLIAVRDVEASSRWYQRLLGCESDMEQGHPHRKEFDRIVSDGRVVLGIHCWAAEPDTPADRLLVDAEAAPHGHGVLMTFQTEDFDAAVKRAREMGVEVVADVFQYPDRSRSILIRDPDGYAIALGSLPEI